MHEARKPNENMGSLEDGENVLIYMSVLVICEFKGATHDRGGSFARERNSPRRESYHLYGNGKQPAT